MRACVRASARFTASSRTSTTSTSMRFCARSTSASGAASLTRRSCAPPRAAPSCRRSELHVAEHLLRRSFEVDALDLAKRSDPVPEFVARKDTLAIAVEVYAPLKWEGLDELMDELSSGIKNLDLPLDYRFEARVEQLEQFDSATASSSSSQRTRARPRRPDARERITAPRLDKVERRPRPGEPDVRVEHDER